MRLIEMTKINRNFRIEFNKEIGTLVSTQDEMKMELENTTTQMENAKESLASRMNQI